MRESELCSGIATAGGWCSVWGSVGEEIMVMGSGNWFKKVLTRVTNEGGSSER